MTATKRTFAQMSRHNDDDGEEKKNRSSSPSTDGSPSFKKSYPPPPPPPPPSSAASASASASASTFRNVSACNRCRLRKNRCDQRLPACAPCEKARVKCVGYDPITKREIPRSYVYYLETRVAYLEALLRERSVPFEPPDDLQPSVPHAKSEPPGESQDPVAAGDAQQQKTALKEEAKGDEGYDRQKVSRLVSNIAMVSVQGASDPRYLGSTSGISFARVVFAAVKSSVSGAPSDKANGRGSKAAPTHLATGGTSIRDSFFGLQSKPTIRPAPFPDKELGLRLVELYFEHANPQIPILHRGEFMELFERTYAAEQRHRTPREAYMLNIVFAIGAGIIVGSPEAEAAAAAAHRSSEGSEQGRLSRQHQPEEYHASAIVHLESFLGSSPATDRPDGFGGGLEELQAVLLLAGFALLRPVAPGLWYIVGVAVRLAVDLGLHYEDGVDIEGSSKIDNSSTSKGHTRRISSPSRATMMGNSSRSSKIDAREMGRRQWVRDLRRRLWWCVYSLDRLVSTCVGRPFGISDQVITTEFPSPLDDRYITKEGFLTPPPPAGTAAAPPSYKRVTYHYVRLRLLQSEILQVLQHRQAQQARADGANQTNRYMHTRLPSPFLVRFASFRAWRADIDRRLRAWKDAAPTQMDTGVQFSPLFFHLNYWQAVIMLYRPSLTVPAPLAEELGSARDDMGSPSVGGGPDDDDDNVVDEEIVFLKVAEAGQKVLKLYKQLHRVHLVNYTFLATHHLFMAGISFLYAVWHSPTVRSRLTLDDVDFTVWAATSVLADLVKQCPPAEACREAFERMAKATIQMCMSTTGFGPQVLARMQTSSSHHHRPSMDDRSEAQPADSQPNVVGSVYPPGVPTKRAPRFDMDLRDLFGDDGMEARSARSNRGRAAAMGPPPPPPPPQSHIVTASMIKQDPYPRGRRAAPHHHHRQSFDISAQAPVMRSPPSPRQQQQQQQQKTYPSPETHLTDHPYSIPPQREQPPPPPSIPTDDADTNMPHAPPPIAYPSNMDTFNDLDFLDSWPSIGSGGIAGNDGGFASGAFSDGGEASAPLDLGFGMGFGGNHDWSDGAGFDIFDTFFFGGGGGGGGM